MTNPGWALISSGHYSTNPLSSSHGKGGRGGGEREGEGELGSVLFGPNILVLFGLDLCNDTDRKAAEEKTSDRSPLTDLEPRRDRRTRHT